MRIAYVCADPGVPVFGRKGCSVHVQEVLRALVAQGTEVTLIATRFDGSPPADFKYIHMHKLPSLPKGDAAEREQAALAANRNLRLALEQEGPFDCIYERHSLWSFAGMEHARIMGVSGILEVNAPLIEEQAEHRILVDRAGAAEATERAFAAASTLVAVSAGIAAYLERFPSIHGRVRVVPNGVRPERFAALPEPALPAPAGTFTVGFLGTLKPWHGLPVLAEAFALLHQRARDTRLLVVGGGTEHDALVENLRARGVLNAAVLTGAVPPEEVPALLASMDVGVAPYPDGPHYFSPLKVFEYMAAGLPVVASRIGQAATLVRDGTTGILCPPGDAAALAAALDRLRREPEPRARLGAAGRAAVLREHTWDAVAHSILELAKLGSGFPSLAGAGK